MLSAATAALGAGVVQRKLARRLAERRGASSPAAGGEAVQRAAAATVEAEAIHRAAEEGIAGPSGALPHQDAIQASFGRHDLSGVKAHVGDAATDASERMGAQAFAAGDHVAFAGSPDLRTAAHEAAHVIQQRAGLQLAGGVGQAGDAHEAHADQAAERVVAGQSAEALLDRDAPPRADEASAARLRPHGGRTTGPGPSLQRKLAATLDGGGLAAAGKDEHLDEHAVTAAVKANDRKWTGGYRLEMLRFLRGSGAVAEGEGFSDADVQKVAQLQHGAGGQADGIIGDHTMAVLLHAGLRFSAEAGKDRAHPTGLPRASEVRIEFWPGELEDLDKWKAAIDAAKEAATKSGNAPMRELNAPEGVGKLYIKVSGRLVAKYNARGGPPRTVKDFGGHTADPTQGSFTVGRQQKGFTTSAWNMSRIGNGTSIRRNGPGDFEMKVGDTWQPVPDNIMNDSIWKLLKPADMKGDQPDPAPVNEPDTRIKTYNQNDFGDMAYKLIPDQGKPDQGFYVHTTPQDEADTTLGKEVKLDHSHGCVHIEPHERDEMIARGYLQAGARFVCKRYDEHLLPEAARQQMMGA